MKTHIICFFTAEKHRFFWCVSQCVNGGFVTGFKDRATRMTRDQAMGISTSLNNAARFSGGRFGAVAVD